MEPQFDSPPGEVVERTLYYFDVSDRQKFRLISKFWNETITMLYGVTLRVHNINLDESLACKSAPISGYFQSLTLPMPMNETGTDFLSRLTSLTFTGVIVCYNIFPVFEQCKQIRKLEFIRCIANQNTREYQVDLDDPSKLLPSLRALVIKLRYSPFNSSEINFFTRLLPFFGSESGKLDKIALDCPVSLDGALRSTFNKIFQKNSILTKQMDRFEPKIADEFYTALLLKNVRTLRNLVMADCGCGCTFNIKLCMENEREDYSNVQFSEFEQVLYSTDSYIDDDCISLSNLLRPQTHLTELTLNVTPTFPMNLVYGVGNRNAETLKTLTISIEEFEFELSSANLDGFLLSPLRVLQNLKYSCLVSPSNRNRRYTLLENFNYLPSSLRTLSTTATIQFENKDDFKMATFQRLQKLETFELLVMPFFEIGKEAIYEMGPQRIRQIISWLPYLKKLVLRNTHAGDGWIYNYDYPLPTPPPPGTDSLPDTATDWINDERGTSFQKDPIVIESPNSNENSTLVGQRGGWESAHYSDPYIPNFQFPLHFDGVILIHPEFRQNTTQST